MNKLFNHLEFNMQLIRVYNEPSLGDVVTLTYNSFYVTLVYSLVNVETLRINPYN